MGYLIFTSILAGELIVVLMAFSKHLIPLKDYSRNISKVQIALSGISVVLAAMDYFYLANSYLLVDMPYTMWSTEIAKSILFIYVIIFVGSICRLFFDYKAGFEEEIITLKKDEYKIRKDFDLVMGDFLYMPNVQAYCDFQGGKILFTGMVPTEEADAKFFCRKIKENVYECNDIEWDGITEGLGVYELINYVAYILAAIDVILLGIWITGGEILNQILLGNIIGIITCLIFGYAVNRIFAKANGFGAKLIYYFSYFIMVAGILRIFIR